jgi:hypothetical protein
LGCLILKKYYLTDTLSSNLTTSWTPYLVRTCGSPKFTLVILAIISGAIPKNHWLISSKHLVFEPVSVTVKGLNIHYTGRKMKDVPSAEMDKWLIHSHNNKFGADSSDVPLGVIKQRIKEFQAQ